MIPKSGHIANCWSQANASAQMKLSTTLHLVEIKLKSASADSYWGTLAVYSRRIRGLGRHPPLGLGGAGGRKNPG